MRRLLKKEVSLDTYTWQKKYGHLTSSVMMAQVDERLKRRFSVSASMEEISKIAEMKSLASQTSLGPEQAALAQSQHFDQLEALWNKRSPPRRRHNSVSAKNSIQISLHTHLGFAPPHRRCHVNRRWWKIVSTIRTRMNSTRSVQVGVDRHVAHVVMHVAATPPTIWNQSHGPLIIVIDLQMHRPRVMPSNSPTF